MTTLFDMFDKYKPTEMDNKIAEMIKVYEDVVGNDFSNATLGLTNEETLEMLNVCIKKKISMWEYLGKAYDPNSEY